MIQRKSDKVRCISKTEGFSLVELMIALLLGVVIMLGAVTLFLQNKRSYLQDEELARMQESGRYALRYLNRELSMAGFFGGVPKNYRIDNLVADPNSPGCYPWILDVEISRQGLGHFNEVDDDGNESGTPPNTPNMPDDCLSNDIVKEDTDILVIRRVKDTPIYDLGTPAPNVNDPNDAVYLRIEDYSNNTLENEVSLPGTGELVDLWEYWPQVLFIRNYAETAGDDIPTLCRLRISRSSETMSPVECLVEGVEDMQLDFGLDTDGDYTVDGFTSDPTEQDLTKALVVRLYLLMRSLNEVTGYTNDKTYVLGSIKTAGPENDGFYRRVYQSSITLRNSEVLGRD